MVEDEVQRLRELAACDESTSQKAKALIDFARVATRVGQHRHLVVLARDVALREPLVVVVDVLRGRPGAHDGRVVDGRDDDFVDVFLRERLCARSVRIAQSRRRVH